MRKLKYLLMVVAACAISSCTKEIQPQDDVEQAPDASYGGGEVEKGWVRIKLQESATPLNVGVFTRGATESGNTNLDKIAQELGATEICRVFDDGGKFAEARRQYGLHLWYDVRFDEEVPVSRAITRFKSMGGVQVIEPIYKAFLVSDAISVPAEAVYTPASYAIERPSAMPFNDPQLKDQWHYNNTGEPGYKTGADINLFAAWEIETGKPTVIVSVHDEGIDVEHDDLKANMWVNTGETPGDGIDNDGNGKTDDINGWSYVNNSGKINKDTHGTHVSGTIAAVNHNGIGVSGVAGGDGNGNGVRIMSCNVIINRGSIVPQAPDSYVYAAENGAVISQNSWTLGTTGELPKAYADAFDYFKDRAGCDETGAQIGPMKGGIILFASANAGGPTMLPGASDKVITVAATGPNYELTRYSSRGPEVDIVAPGGEGNGEGTIRVLSLDVNNGYAILWGTSMACPHVSGIAALIVSKFGKQGFTAEECKTKLLNGYRPLGGYVDDNNLGNIGSGLADAKIALMDATTAAPATVTSATVTTAENNLKLSWGVPADGNGLPVRKYIVEYTGTAPGVTRSTQTSTLTNNFDVGKTVTYTIRVAYNMDYNIKVYSVDRYGNKSAAVSLTATTNNFENKAPVRKKNMADVAIETVGSENKLTYFMSDYISDANLSQGDVLTFTVVSSQPLIVNAEIVDGRNLVVTPTAKGKSYITVTATDLAGASVNTSFNVTVLSGPVVPPDPTEPTVGGDVMIYPNPVDSDLNFELSDVNSRSVEITIYDAASRKLMTQSVAIGANGKGLANVSKLAPGVYTLVVNIDALQVRSNFIKR